MERPNEPSSPKILSQILEHSVLPPISASTSKSPAKSSSTSGREMATSKPTGRPPSEIVLDSLRNVAKTVQQGQPLNDQMLGTLLQQWFGSERFASKPRLKHIYGDGGYDCEVVGHDVSLDALHDNEMKLFEAMEFLNRPATQDFVDRQIGRLRVVMARTSESHDDITLLVNTYSDHLAEFPPDVVKGVCDQIINDHKWFPLVCEMRKEMLRRVAFRQSVLEKFRHLRDPILAAKEMLRRIEADPRNQIHWKMLPRVEWLPKHYKWWIADAEHMVELAKQNQPSMDLPGWEAEISRRKAALEAAFPERHIPAAENQNA